MEIEHFAVDNGVLDSIVDFVRASQLPVAWAFVDSTVVALVDIDDHNVD